MEKSIELTSEVRNQYVVVFGISIVIAIFTGILYARDASIFQLFFGRINPLAAISVVLFLGMVLLMLLQSRDWFAIFTVGNYKGLLLSSSLAALLGLLMILIDRIAVFPSDINQLFPDSLFFYPVFGYVVEVVFHLLPLSVSLLFLSALLGEQSLENWSWLILLVVASIEPIFQTALGSSRPYPTWLVGYVFLHIFVINLIQLLIFRRYDFVSMFSFRLVYYAIWHIAWGSARLRLLF